MATTRTLRPILWHSIVLGCAMACVSTASANVIYEEKVDTFDIGVRSGDARAVWSGISRWGPSANGGHALGTTTGRLKWAFKRSSSARGCTIHDIKVTVQADILLPGWPYATRADGKTQTFWKCIHSLVSVHEQRHAEIWRETAHAIDDALRGLSDPMRCEAVEGTVNTIANRLHEDGRKRQEEFDAAEYKLGRERTCFENTDSAKLKDAPTTDEPATAQPIALEQIPYPMPQLATRVDDEEELDTARTLNAHSIPLGVWLSAAGVIALFGTTYVVVSTSQAASRRARDAAVAEVEASLDFAQQSREPAPADRRKQPDRRVAPRADGDSPGRRASDFGRRTS